MYEILLKITENNRQNYIMYYHINEYKELYSNRVGLPYALNKEYIMILNVECQRWFEDSNIWYDLKEYIKLYTNPNNLYLDAEYFYIVFKDKADAMLFKLYWIGV